MTHNQSSETLPVTIQAQELPADKLLGVLEPVAHFDGAMPTGVSVSNQGRIFVNFPKWGDEVEFKLFNLLFLMCIAFLPFPTAVLAKYITDAQQQQTAVILYALGLLLSVLAWLLIWLYASRDHRLVNKNLDDKFIAHLTRQYTLSCVLYFLALVLSLWNGIVGLALCVGLTLLYLLPQKKPVYYNGGA